MSRNSCCIIKGYIGKTIEEYSNTKDNKPFVKFSVCEYRRFGNKSQSIWYQITVFGDQAVALVKRGWLTKGYEAAVMASPSFGSYVNKKGVRIQTHDFIADWVVCNERLLVSKSHVDAENEAKNIDESIADEQVDDLEAAF